MDELHHRVVQRIKDLARERKIPLSHLADRAGVARSHFWDVLATRKSPTLLWIGRIARALEVDVADFVVPGGTFKETSDESRRRLPLAADRVPSGPTPSKRGPSQQ